MTSTTFGTASSHKLSDSEADTIPQFFISVVNRSSSAFTLTACQASAGCGWVQEAQLGQVLAPESERIWCGMPWDMDYVIRIHLILSSQDGGEIDILLDRPAGAAASLTVQLHGLPGLQADTQLQRAASASPFVMIGISPR